MMMTNIQAHHTFQPVAVELLGPMFHLLALSFLNSVASLLVSRATTEKSAFIISATLRFDSAVQCHLTA